MKRKIVLSTLIAASILSGCATGPKSDYKIVSKEKLSDAFEPSGKIVTVDFSGMLGSTADFNYDVPPLSSVKPMMKRVMLSPNLVFEASRHSLNEPKATTGPENDNGDAIGHQVPERLSSLLMNYMNSNGSELIAPAITREIMDKWCNWYEGKYSCSNMTWVERLLKMSRSNNSELQKIGPTAGLAVRRLETTENNISLVVAKEGDRVIIKPRKYKEEASLCGSFSLTVPAVYLSTELLDAKSGRIIARFEHSKGAKLSGNLKYTAKETNWKPVYETGYTKYIDYGSYERPVKDSSYQYIERYEEEGVLCGSIKSKYADIRKTTESSMNIDVIANGLFSETIGKLYR